MYHFIIEPDAEEHNPCFICPVPGYHNQYVIGCDMFKEDDRIEDRHYTGCGPSLPCVAAFGVSGRAE